MVVITHDERYLDELSCPLAGFSMDEGRFVGRQSVENG